MEARANTERPGAAYVGPGEGRAVWVLGGQLLTYKVTAEQTGGAYSLFEGTVPPGGGAPAHIHHREDESFYVVEGEFEFTRDGETIRAGAGSLVYVPRGILHAFENVGENTGTLLLSQTPGGLHELFFEEVGEEAADGATPPVPANPPDLSALVAAAARYGTEVPTPPAS